MFTKKPTKPPVSPVKKPLGLILYEGKSKFDGKPIVVIATNVKRKSRNEKTGGVIQCWIIRSDINPVKAYCTGEDVSVCCLCKHRIWGTCYVTVFHSPLHIYRVYKRGSYARLDKDNIQFLKDKIIRIGAYGETGVVPIYVWDKLKTVAKNIIGYTHMWKNCNKRLSDYCMASVDSPKEMKQAIEQGWRTFRIRYKNQPILDNEIMCPGSKEKKNKITCLKCGSCCGNSRNGKNIAIKAHGVGFKIRKLESIFCQNT
jgi:hypothetical protein